MSIARRGFTIVEMLVVLALFGLCGLMVARLLAPTLRYQQRTLISSGLHEEAMVAQGSLANDLRRSESTGITILPRAGPNDTAAIGMDRLQDGPFHSTPAWESQIVIYRWAPADHTLVRRTLPPAPPWVLLPFSSLHAIACPPDVLALAASTTSSSDRILSRRVSSFVVSTVAPGLVQVDLTLQSAPFQGVAATCTIGRRVYLRNDG